jgi:hypothetical protein
MTFTQYTSEENANPDSIYSFCNGTTTCAILQYWRQWSGRYKMRRTLSLWLHIISKRIVEGFIQNLAFLACRSGQQYILKVFTDFTFKIYPNIFKSSFTELHSESRLIEHGTSVRVNLNRKYNVLRLCGFAYKHLWELRSNTDSSRGGIYDQQDATNSQYLLLEMLYMFRAIIAHHQ